MLRKKSILFIMLMLFLPLAWAQSITVFKPRLLDKPLPSYESGSVLSASGVHTGVLWTVYAAMEGVKGYRNESLSTGEKSFAFMTPFVVIEERANTIRVVEASHVAGTSLRAGYESHAYWFQKKDLLLWNRAMFQTNVVVGEFKAEFFRKAMVINRLEMTSTELAETGFFSKPTIDRSFLLEEARSFNILFVFKETENALLLGTRQEWPDNANARAVIRGWVSRQYLTPWNHHLALEMNWENTPERRLARVYSNLESARVFQNAWDHTPTAAEGNIIYSEQILPGIDRSRRSIGTLNRFFVLTEGIDMTDRFPKLGVVGEVKMEGITDSDCLPSVIPPEKVAEIRRKVINGIEKRQTVNLLFVVDGTRSMERYSQSIIASLKTTLDSIMKGSADNDIKYNIGGVIFRDQRDAYPIDVSNYGNWTTDIDLMDKFFSENMIPARNSRENNTHPEGLYHGIVHAIDTYRADPLHTNYLILIGDAGDNPQSYPNITIETVIERIHRYNYNLLAYQIQHLDMTDRITQTRAYDDFRTQVKQIMEAVALRKNRPLRTQFTQFVNSCPTAAGFFRPLLNNLPAAISSSDFQTRTLPGMVREMIVPSDKFPIIAKAMFADNDGSISVNMLSSYLMNDIRKLAIDTEEFLASITGTLGGLSAEGVHTARVVMFALQLGLRVDEIVMLLSVFKEVYQEGFSAFHPVHSGRRPLFNYVAWMSHMETNRTRQHFLRFITPNQPVPEDNLLRDRIYDIWKRILVSELQLITESEFNGLTLAQNITYLTGLPAPEEFARYRNRDIHFASQFPERLLFRLCIDLIVSQGYMNSVVEGNNMMNEAFFRSYRPYLVRFLQMEGVNITSTEAYNSFIRSLENRFSRENFRDYPRMTVEPSRPQQPLFWYYYVDTRAFPSQIGNPSETILQQAREFFN